MLEMLRKWKYQMFSKSCLIKLAAPFVFTSGCCYLISNRPWEIFCLKLNFLFASGCNSGTLDPLPRVAPSKGFVHILPISEPPGEQRERRPLDASGTLGQCIWRGPHEVMCFFFFPSPNEEDLHPTNKNIVFETLIVKLA